MGGERENDQLDEEGLKVEILQRVSYRVRVLGTMCLFSAQCNVSAEHTAVFHTTAKKIIACAFAFPYECNPKKKVFPPTCKEASTEVVWDLHVPRSRVWYRCREVHHSTRETAQLRLKIQPLRYGPYLPVDGSSLSDTIASNRHR